MELLEKIQKAYDSMKAHETVNIELDWYEVCKILAMTKADEVHVEQLQSALFGNLFEDE